MEYFFQENNKNLNPPEKDFNTSKQKKSIEKSKNKMLKKIEKNIKFLEKSSKSNKKISRKKLIAIEQKVKKEVKSFLQNLSYEGYHEKY